MLVVGACDRDIDIAAVECSHAPLHRIADRSAGSDYIVQLSCMPCHGHCCSCGARWGGAQLACRVARTEFLRASLTLLRLCCALWPRGGGRLVARSGPISQGMTHLASHSSHFCRGVFSYLRLSVQLWVHYYPLPVRIGVALQCCQSHAVFTG